MRRLDEALAAAMQLWFEEGERIYLPDDVFDALVIKLERHVLPFARYGQWCAHGVRKRPAIYATLTDCGIDGGRAEELEVALLGLEPFRSKKEIHRFHIHKVLADVGDTWPEYRRRDHERSN